MKEHFCPAEKTTITYQGKCNWCGESEGSMNEIIEMAKEAGIIHPEMVAKHLVAFANLVAAKEREEANARANASWELMCKKMVAVEREACAKIVEESSLPDAYSQECMPDIANDIRARAYKQDGQCKRCTDGCPACDARKLPKEAHDLL